MVDPAFPDGPPTLLVCGDHAPVVQQVISLCRELGWSDILDVGPLARARLTEALRRVRRGLAASGDVNHEGQLIRGTELGNEAEEGLPEVGNCGPGARTFAVSPHARLELGMRAPDAVLVLLDGVRDMHGTGHRG
jgi:hypothetical protein